METEWCVLTLLKIHVSKSHVSCLSHKYLEEWGWKEKHKWGGVWWGVANILRLFHNILLYVRLYLAA